MGGNVFLSSGPISRENIEPTLERFYSTLGRIFPSAKNHINTIKTLGSVGKKEQSGDIDLALSAKVFKNIGDWSLDEKIVKDYFTQFEKRARNAKKEQIVLRAVIEALADKIEQSSEDISVDRKGTSKGMLFLAFPQFDPQGNKLDKYVQIDINVGDINWLSFSYFSDKYEGNIKGLHRTQLILSLFGRKGYLFNHNYGVKNKETQEIVARNPKQAISILNKEYNADFTESILSNYFTLQEYIRKTLPEDIINKVYDSYLKILDSTRADIPEDLQQYWIQNQERLGLSGKFLPDNSNLLKYKVNE